MGNPPLPEPPPFRTLDFDEVLGVLFAWQGSHVHAGVDAFRDPPLMPAWALGQLGVDRRHIADPFDGDEFEFTIGEPQPQPRGDDRYPGGFSIHRRFFQRGTLISDSRLIIDLREQDEHGLYELSVHIVRHGDPQ